MVKYNYDAWGNHEVELVDSGYAYLAEWNPLRYRGYYYDVETGLYYLDSRYYDPETGRFITIDDLSYLDPETINGLNLYAYCGNNPVMNVDPTGHEKTWWQWLLFGIAVVALAAVTVAGAVMTGGASLVPALVGFGIGAGANLLSQGIGNLQNGNGFFNNINWLSVVVSSLAGAAFGTGIGGFYGAVTVGAVANMGIAATEEKSFGKIMFSAVIGGRRCWIWIENVNYK